MFTAVGFPCNIEIVTMKRFCPKCGAGTDYTVVKPSFCGRCGSSYEGAIAAARPAAPVVRPTRAPVRVVEPEPEYQDEEQYDEEGNARETNFDPNEIAGLEVKIVAPPRGKVTYGELGLSQKTSDTESFRTIPKKVDRRAILDDLLPNRHASKQQGAAKKPVRRSKRG